MLVLRPRIVSALFLCGGISIVCGLVDILSDAHIGGHTPLVRATVLYGECVRILDGLQNLTDDGAAAVAPLFQRVNEGEVLGDVFHLAATDRTQGRGVGAVMIAVLARCEELELASRRQLVLQIAHRDFARFDGEIALTMGLMLNELGPELLPQLAALRGKSSFINDVANSIETGSGLYGPSRPR